MKIKVIGLLVASCIATQAVAEVDTPSHLYGRLFEDVQTQRVFPDSKTFVDALPNDAPAATISSRPVRFPTSPATRSGLIVRASGDRDALRRGERPEPPIALEELPPGGPGAPGLEDAAVAERPAVVVVVGLRPEDE